MSTKILSMPEDALVTMLKALPKNALLGVFWKTVVECDTSPLSSDEKEDSKKARSDFKKGETVRWQDLR